MGRRQTGDGRLSLRHRYYVLVSAGYTVLGIVIIARSVISGVAWAGIFGAVLVVLGLIRVRDFARWKRGLRDR